MAADKNMSVNANLPSDLPMIRGDATLLTQVLVNLLSNAVKYTPEGGKVSVAASPQDGSLQIEVQDTGQGIPAEAVPNLFDRFYRVPGSEVEIEGSGLGLSIVKSIVEKHGGRVWAESELDKGSTFAFTVPRAQEEASPQARVAHEP
jgi:signal transduction histidine kinase